MTFNCFSTLSFKLPRNLHSIFAAHYDDICFHTQLINFSRRLSSDGHVIVKKQGITLGLTMKICIFESEL